MFSIVLMAVVDANSDFLMVDVGANGRISDGGVFSNTKFCQKLNLPEPSAVFSYEINLPNVLVADDTFSLSETSMKPYGHGMSHLSKSYSIENCAQLELRWKTRLG